MTNYQNGFSGTPVKVWLSKRANSLLDTLSKQSQTRPSVYLEELIEVALMNKLMPDCSPNAIQRLAVETAVCGSEVDHEG
jgi:hypothetical protein